MKNNVILLFLAAITFNINAQVSDIENNSYKTKVIGNKEWMTENLNVSRFKNGDAIPQVTSAKQWMKYAKKKKPAWCYYAFDTKNGEKYGKLYNWYAVNDKRDLAPNGWHVTTDDDWKNLIKTLGGEENAGGKMKSIVDWTEDKNSTNESGFNALPGGMRLNGDNFDNIGYYGFWWTSTEAFETNAWSYSLYYLDSSVQRKVNYKYAGLSVRCVRN